MVFNIHVQPRASRDEITGIHGDRIKIRITAPPVDGKANEHLMRFLAIEFKVSIALASRVSGRATRGLRVM